MNVFTITGRLTKDPVARQTTGGRQSAFYTLASDDFYYDKDGKRHETVNYIPITSYDRQAENDLKHLKKGALVGVTGKLTSWYNATENKGGVVHRAEKVDYLAKAGGNAGAGDSVPPQQDGDLPAADDWLSDYSAHQGRRP